MPLAEQGLKWIECCISNDNLNFKFVFILILHKDTALVHVLKKLFYVTTYFNFYVIILYKV